MGRKASQDWDEMAAEALAKAEKMPPGEARNEAIDKANRLADAARMRRLCSSKELRPPR